MHSVLCGVATGGNVGSLPDGAGGHGQAGLLGQPHPCCRSLYHCIVTRLAPPHLPGHTSAMVTWHHITNGPGHAAWSLLTGHNDLIQIHK